LYKSPAFAQGTPASRQCACRSSQRRAVEKIRVSILLPNILQKILDKIGIQASLTARKEDAAAWVAAATFYAASTI
jgi:hypothetical protein